MENKSCKNCANYRQHYAFDKRRIFRVNCGHCVLHRPKRKRPDSVACEKFTPTEKDIDAFVNREYLSKALLNYVLNLKLLPEIEDSAEKIS